MVRVVSVKLDANTLVYTDRPDYGQGAVECAPAQQWPGDPVWVRMATPAGPAVEIEVSYATSKTDVWMDAMVVWVKAPWYPTSCGPRRTVLSRRSGSWSFTTCRAGPTCRCRGGSPGVR